jgi:hypothetical protein
MTRYWYKSCPRCKQGQLFIEFSPTSSSLFLLCDECYWAFSDPSTCDDVNDGYFGFDTECKEPTLAEINAGGWLGFALHVVKN